MAMVTYFGMEIAGARIQGLALSSLVTLVIGACDGSNILLFVSQPSQNVTYPYHNPYHNPYLDDYDEDSANIIVFLLCQNRHSGHW